MKILFLTHRLPYAPNKGDRIRAYHMLKHLAPHAQVHLVSLVANAAEEAKAADLRGWLTSVSTVRRSWMRGAVRSVAALVRRQPLTHALLDGAAMHATLDRIVAQHVPDLVFAYGSGMARFALGQELAALPMVLDMVDVDSAKWRELSKTAGVAKRWIYAREARRLGGFERAAARASRATLVVNERERALLKKGAPDAPVLVVPNGVELEHFRAFMAPADSARVVFCGVMNYAPNVNAMLWFASEVWPRVTKSRPDARLTIVGSRPARAIRALARRDATIDVTGAVPDVRPFLWRSAVAVAPLWLARGIQNKVLEAVAAGLPTVVTPAVFEGLPRDAETGCVVASSAERFADSVLRLLALRARERRAIAEQAALHSLGWDVALQPLLPLLERARFAAN